MKRIISVILSALLVCTVFAACGSKEDDKTITVGASSTPHAEILEIVKEQLAKEGYTLNIKVYDDYVLPNTATEEGEVDANYFQHLPYLEDFNAQQGTHLVSVAGIHVEPMGLYGGKQTTLDAVSGK